MYAVAETASSRAGRYGIKAGAGMFLLVALFSTSCGYSKNGSSSGCFLNTLNVMPTTASADHNMMSPGNSQQFVAFAGQSSMSGCLYAQSNLSSVTWSVSDPASVTIGNGGAMMGSPGDMPGMASCVRSTSSPVTITATLPPDQNSGHMASGTAMLTCR